MEAESQPQVSAHAWVIGSLRGALTLMVSSCRGITEGTTEDGAETEGAWEDDGVPEGSLEFDGACKGTVKGRIPALLVIVRIPVVSIVRLTNTNNIPYDTIK